MSLFRIALTVVLLILVCSSVGLAQATASRGINPDTVEPGQVFTVTVTVAASEAISNLRLSESLHPLFTVTPVNNGGASYSAPGVWLWTTVNPGDSHTVVYTVAVSGCSCVCGTYNISGVVNSNSPQFSDQVGGEDRFVVALSPYTLTMAVDGNGSTIPAVGDHAYSRGTTVALTATPDPGWLFDHWSGAVTGSTNPASVTMSGDKSVTAHFVRIQHTLTMAIDGNGSTTPVVGDHTYDEGTVVPLVATPNAGWAFDHWSGDLTGSANPASVTMDGARSVTAHFVRIQHTLTMAIDGNGSTTPAVGAHTYNEGVLVPLVATPDAGWLFDHWSGDVTGAANPNLVTMDGDRLVTAHFVRMQHTLIIAVDGSGSATPMAGAHTYDEGTVVPLTATPEAGWQFDYWSGDLTGSANPASVTMDGNRSVTAHFVRIQHTLIMAIDGGGSTTPTVGAHTYDEGTVVPLTATPEAGWQFDYWSGDLTGSANPASVTMDGNRSVTAHFVRIQHTLTMAVDGSGSITPAVGDHTYDEGTVVPLVGTPDVGWLFDHWSGDLTGSANPTSVTMNGNKQVVAHFVEIPTTQYTLTLAVDGSGSTTPTVGDHTYDEGTVVSLIASPDAGWVFDHWSGNVTDPNSADSSIVMNTDDAVTAVFAELLPELCVQGSLEHDFGIVHPGEPATWSFVVKNCGEAVLQWHFRTKGTQSWLSVQPVDGTLAVGESVKVKVVVDTSQLIPKPRYRARFIVASDGGSKEGVFDVGVALPCVEQEQVLEFAGWQLLSLPGELCGDCVTDADGDLCCALSDDLSPCHVLYYDTERGDYSPLDLCQGIEHHIGMGFWVWGSKAERIDVDLRVPLEPTQIVLKKGWNQVGLPFGYPVALEDIKVINGNHRDTLERAQAAGWIGEYLFLYEPEVGYCGLPLASGLLEPWEGYWIRAFEDCELLIPNKPASTSGAQTLVDEEELRRQGVDLPPAAPPPVEESR